MPRIQECWSEESKGRNANRRMAKKRGDYSRGQMYQYLLHTRDLQPKEDLQKARKAKEDDGGHDDYLSGSDRQIRMMTLIRMST